MVLQSINIQRQPNSRDCGLFAIAVAIELAQRRDPRLCYWDVSQMRHHLIQSLEVNGITSFPLAKARRIPLGNVVKCTKTVKLFCICRIPNVPSKPMIKWDKCNKWFHHECM